MAKEAKRSKVDLLLEVFYDPDRKPLLKIISEFFVLLFYHKSLPKLRQGNLQIRKAMNSSKTDRWSKVNVFGSLEVRFVDGELADIV